MELITTQKLDLKEIKELLEEEYSEYEIAIKKGAFFEAIIIKKSSLNGVGVRISGDKIITYKTIPSLLGRMLPILGIIAMSGDGLLEGVDWVLENKYANI